MTLIDEVVAKVAESATDIKQMARDLQRQIEQIKNGSNCHEMATYETLARAVLDGNVNEDAAREMLNDVMAILGAKHVAQGPPSRPAYYEAFGVTDPKDQPDGLVEATADFADPQMIKRAQSVINKAIELMSGGMDQTEALIRASVEDQEAWDAFDEMPVDHKNAFLDKYVDQKASA